MIVLNQDRMGRFVQGVERSGLHLAVEIEKFKFVLGLDHNGKCRGSIRIFLMVGRNAGTVLKKLAMQFAFWHTSGGGGGNGYHTWKTTDPAPPPPCSSPAGMAV